MTNNILLYAWSNSKKQQIYLILITLLFLPLLYFTFELPKIIINDAISVGSASFPQIILGIEFNQVTFLLLLCFAFLALVLASFGTLYHLSVYKGVLAEVLLRRLRFDLYQRILRFPARHRQIPEWKWMEPAQSGYCSGRIGSALRWRLDCHQTKVARRNARRCAWGAFANPPRNAGNWNPPPPLPLAAKSAPDSRHTPPWCNHYRSWPNDKVPAP